MVEQCQLCVGELGAVAGNHVQEGNGVEGVLPVNDEKWLRLLVQKEVLSQEAPEGERLAIGLVRRVGIVAKGLDIADRTSLNGCQLFEGRARIHAAVVIDGENAFPEIDGYLRVRARAEMVVGDGKGAGKSRLACAIFFAIWREAKGAVGEGIAEAKAVGCGVREVFDAHF